MQQSDTLETVIRQANEKYTAQMRQKDIRYTINGSGCRHKVDLLGPAVFRIAIYLSLQIDCQFPFFVMITASHNPAQDNGIKLFCPQSFVLSREFFSQIQSTVNNDELFHDYVHKQTNQLLTNDREQKLRYMYLGRDCRLSSPSFQLVFTQALNIAGVRSVSIGICSTPQFLALSQHIWRNYQINNAMLKLDIQQIHGNYISEILDQFETVYTHIHHSPQKLKLYIDFANGSGAISYQPYSKVLTKYLDITLQHISDYAKPNAECGAQYIYKHWSTVIKDNKYSDYDFCVFFDGDSDRIIVKVRDSDQPFDGNSFLLLYREALLKIIENLPSKIKCQLHQQLGKFQINTFGNINSNLGVQQHLIKQNSKLHISQVGFRSLYKTAIHNQTLSIMFQPNGHGSIYMCKQLINFLLNNQYQQSLNFELKLLITIYKLIQNNSAGYALHNMLLMLIFSEYLYGDEFVMKMRNNYEKYYVRSKELVIKNEYCEEFCNSEKELCELIGPGNIVKSKNYLQSMYIDYDIKVRKSTTTNNIVRIHIQGKNMTICEQIEQKLLIIMKEYNQ